MPSRSSLAKTQPHELVYEFDWRTDAECQEFARDHLLSDRLKSWMNALAAETAHIGWMLRALPQTDPRVAELRRRWGGAKS